MFTDKSWLIATSGNGGKGAVAWNRSKTSSKGGPAGGNGGKGGSVMIMGDTNCHDLSHIRYHHFFKAKNGKPGQSNKRRGKNAENIVIKVPFGTEITCANTGDVVFDIDVSCKHPFVLCEGGGGGLGNFEFKASTHQSPYEFTDGEKGSEKKIYLELKSIADVGLIGMPSVGKSSILNSVGHASFKTGSYPFTTLHPNLCVIKKRQESCGVVIADVPGIIEDASNNKGLGIGFLRHIERCSMIMIVVDAINFNGFSQDKQIEILVNEMNQYNNKLLSKICGVIINKNDLLEEESCNILCNDLEKKYKYRCFSTSTITNKGMEDLRIFLLHKV